MIDSTQFSGFASRDINGSHTGFSDDLPRPEVKEEAWEQNTPANPFWSKSPKLPDGKTQPVEVEMFNGQRRVLRCPPCNRGIFRSVTRWRLVPRTSA